MHAPLPALSAAKTLCALCALGLLLPAARAADAAEPAEPAEPAAAPAPERLLSTVTADRLEFDYRELVAFLDGHVRVDDPQLQLEAGKVLLYLTTNAVGKAGADPRAPKADILKLVALGGVRASMEIRDKDGKYEKSTLACGKATYTRDGGSLVLEGRPEVKHGAQGTLQGDRITLWLDGRNRVEFIEVEGGVRLQGTVPAKVRGKPDKPAEDKPAEEDKPKEDKPDTGTPEENTPEDTKPAEDKPAEDKPKEDKPAKPAPKPKH